MAPHILPLKQHSAELLGNPETLRLILDTADIPINYCSSDQTFLFCNETYAKWYGRTPDQIIGKTIIEILGEEGYNTVSPYFARALQGEHFRYETEVNLSIGYRYIQCSYTPVYNNSGEVTGWVGIIYDMTQRYLMEKTLQENESKLKMAKEKAEAANIAKSEFMATMSHEIRTPMNAVLGLSHILNMSSPLTEKQKEYIKTLQLSAQSLLTLINDLLDFSKSETNSIDLEHLPFNFASIIDEIINMFTVEAREKNVEIIYERSGLDSTSFLGDPLRIRQILTNLVSNALKFTPSGSITINLSSTPSSDPSHIYIHASVKDTGIGIAINKHSAVFDKFVQADMSITRQYGGSGLGLAISKNLAELMGGSITLNSSPGDGSEFILHIPVEYYGSEGKITAPIDTGKNNIHPQQRRNISILLAEDYSPNILVATTLLESMGYSCDVARTGKEVLSNLMNGKHYDIILMDVRMPELDGYSTTSIIRENEKKENKKRIPIIGVTAHVMSDSIDKCYKAGMDDYVAKPFEAEDLRQKILKLLK